MARLQCLSHEHKYARCDNSIQTRSATTSFDLQLFAWLSVTFYFKVHFAFYLHPQCLSMGSSSSTVQHTQTWRKLWQLQSISTFGQCHRLQHLELTSAEPSFNKEGYSRMVPDLESTRRRSFVVLHLGECSGHRVVCFRMVGRLVKSKKVCRCLLDTDRRTDHFCRWDTL